MRLRAAPLVGRDLAASGVAAAASHLILTSTGSPDQDLFGFLISIVPGS
jgi:hypothetical protein